MSENVDYKTLYELEKLKNAALLEQRNKWMEDAQQYKSYHNDLLVALCGGGLSTTESEDSEDEKDTSEKKIGMNHLLDFKPVNIKTCTPSRSNCDKLEPSNIKCEVCTHNYSSVTHAALQTYIGKDWTEELEQEINDRCKPYKVRTCTLSRFYCEDMWVDKIRCALVEGKIAAIQYY